MISDEFPELHIFDPVVGTFTPIEIPYELLNGFISSCVIRHDNADYYVTIASENEIVKFTTHRLDRVG